MDRMTTCYAMVLAMVVGLAGCGQKGPKVQYVEGVVTLDGNPVEGATVGFSPVEKDKGMAASGPLTHAECLSLPRPRAVSRMRAP